jgi:hypothetical protein
MDLLTVDLDGAHPSWRERVSGEVVCGFASVRELLEVTIRRCL